jgi:hypothetical protein
VTSPQAFEGLRLAGRIPWRAAANLAVPDHNVPTLNRALGIADPVPERGVLGASSEAAGAERRQETAGSRPGPGTALRSGFGHARGVRSGSPLRRRKGLRPQMARSSNWASVRERDHRMSSRRAMGVRSSRGRRPKGTTRAGLRPGAGRFGTCRTGWFTLHPNGRDAGSIGESSRLLLLSFAIGATTRARCSSPVECRPSSQDPKAMREHYFGG